MSRASQPSDYRAAATSKRRRRPRPWRIRWLVRRIASAIKPLIATVELVARQYLEMPRGVPHDPVAQVGLVRDTIADMEQQRPLSRIGIAVEDAVGPPHDELARLHGELVSLEAVVLRSRDDFHGSPLP